MKPAAFDYFAPRSVEEAVTLLAEHGDEAKVLAGGQSLVPMMAFRLATPSVLIDLNGVAELEHAGIEGDALVLGAMARHASVQALEGLARRAPLIAEGVALIGHPAIRNRGTVGGSLAHADPAAEWPGLLLALDGEVQVIGPNGSRTIAAGALFDTYFTTTMQPDELITGVRLPIPHGGSAFVEFAQRHGDFALAGVAAALRRSDAGVVEDVRIALIGVGDTPVRAVGVESVLRGIEPTDEAVAEAARAVDADIDPLSDVHGSSDYRRRLAVALTRRALALARDRDGPP
jgi:carbon-monoxide dehydrogenase medium subunit